MISIFTYISYSTQTYPRCDNSARLASTQECVTESYDCSEECQDLGGTGVLNTQFGLCDCQETIDPRSVCTDRCLSCRPTTSLEEIDGIFTVTVTNCENVEIYREQFLDMYSFSSESNDPQTFQLVSFSSDGDVRGSLFFDDQETVNSLSELLQESTNVRKRRNLESYDERFKRQSESTNPLSQAIPNPLICLEVGEAVVFQISRDDNGSTHYPVYNKEHLLNSNPGFDYGAFRQLATFLQSNVNISLFVHTFTEPGTYYFRDSVVPSNQMVVTVMQDGTTCERNGDEFRVLPSSSSYLIQYGIVSQPILSQEPNFTVIIATMITGLFVLCIVVLGILIWRPKSVGIRIPSTLKPRYRRLNEPHVVYISETSKDFDRLEKSRLEVSNPVCPQSSEISTELENFNVKTFYDKLEDQTLHVSSQLARQQADLVRFYDQILQQTESLKSLVSESCVIKTVEKNRQFQHSLTLSREMDREDPVKTTSAHSNFYKTTAHLSSQEEELMDILKGILTTIKKNSTKKDKHTLKKWIPPQEVQDRALLKEDLQKAAVDVETWVSTLRM